MENAFYYNALAIETGGNYGPLKKLAEENGADWQAVYEKYKYDNPFVHDPEKEWEKLERQNIRLILFSDVEYPPLLREIVNPPLGIYVRGSIPCEENIPIAIVGTRRATNDGKTTARQFANELSRYGFAIISGLAFGIDAAAHEGCLDAYGTTVAVLASGVDIISPRTNDRLAKKILDNGGAIVSEYPPGAEAVAYRFIERNRIISGLSKGVLVIEAPESSGALATVRFAIEQNRDVFIVPGPIAHPNFAGSHELIRNGAELVAKPTHIAEAYGIIQKRPFAGNDNDCSTEERLILDTLRENVSGADVDKIIAMTKLEAQTANQTLSFLLIKGMIRESAGKYMIE